VITIACLGGRFSGGRGRHTRGAEAPSLFGAERPKAEALGYLDVKFQ
jgi:hypothetical protein